MSKPDKTLDPKILDAAKKEFLEKGYEKASTNAICKSAGVTWGALQKRYSGKDALFCALVAPVAEEFKATLIGSNEDFHAQTKEQQEAAALHADRDGNPFVEYIYGHFDVFRLLLRCAGGSSYEHYMDDLVDILERSPAASWKPQAMRLLSTEKKPEKKPCISSSVPIFMGCLSRWRTRWRKSRLSPM